jgi:ATP-dependent Clp protease ATP-binding subunit ClpB
VDFRNTVLIMTSNLGSQLIQELSERRPWPDVREAAMGVLREHFRPEFLNRVDEVIVFRPLTREQLASIVDIQVERLRRRLAERKIGLVLTDAARALLAERGWDPVYGARPLKRTIQRLVQDELATRLLRGEFAEGDTVEIDVGDGELTFAAARTAPVAAT